jgi:hypothetical protein
LLDQEDRLFIAVRLALRLGGSDARLLKGVGPALRRQHGDDIGKLL